MVTRFADYLKALNFLSADQSERFAQAGIPAQAQKGDMLFTEGTPCLKLWFIETGIVRAYRIIDNKDVTFFFFSHGDFAVDYESFLTEQESPLFLEALTDCSLLVFSKRTTEALYEQDPMYHRFGRLMAETAYISATERLKQFQVDPLAVRYEKLLKKDPDLFQQIPQYHIASYLGVKPQSLSRIRAEFRNA